MATMPSREEEIAWAAGLFEGEGCIYQGRGGILGTRLTSTDEDIPVRFCQIVRGGKVYGPYRNTKRDGHSRKPFWVWVGESVDAPETLRLIFPWLGPRRRAKARELTAREKRRLGLDGPDPDLDFPGKR
jgi:hypothetical protein